MWNEILQQHDIDPQMYGFTELIVSSVPTIPSGAMLAKPEGYYGYLAVYLATFDLYYYYLTPAQTYEKNLAAPRLTLFQLQQRLGSIPGNATGVVSWVEYLNLFIDNTINVYDEAAKLFTNIMAMDNEQRALTGYDL
jgi:hypothetical protein